MAQCAVELDRVTIELPDRELDLCRLLLLRPLFCTVHQGTTDALSTMVYGHSQRANHRETTQYKERYGGRGAPPNPSHTHYCSSRLCLL